MVSRQAFMRHSVPMYTALCEENNLYAAPLDSYVIATLKSATDYKLMLENVFIAPVLREYFSSVYIRGTRLFMALRRIIKRYTRLRMPYRNTQDFSMNPIDSHTRGTIDVVDAGQKYRFRVSDLLKLVHASLTHSIEFFCDALPIQNPYTGKPFTKLFLYSLFAYLQDSTFIMPPLFGHFMSVDCHLEDFMTQFEGVIRDEIIQSTIENYAKPVLHAEIRHMLENVKVFDGESFKFTCIFRHTDRVMDTELDQFKPWLHLYFLYLYSLNPNYRHKAFTTLVSRMRAFRRSHPEFCAKPKKLKHPVVIGM